MSKGFFCRLAAGNMKKNARTYGPYLLTCILTVALYYIVKSLSLNPGLAQMTGADTLSYILDLGSNIMAIFSFVFLFYTNSFLMKRRQRELGVFHVLGMEKKHLARVLGWENLYVIGISLVAGLVVGVTLDKLLFLLIVQMLDGEVSLGFFLSPKAFQATVILFFVIFLLILVNAVRRLQSTAAIELLRGAQMGEKEPKTKGLLAVAGVLCLGAGYALALTIKNPVASLALFFPAVILVIAGTYLLFTAGSIAFLKLLRKNKGYYYQTRHFTSISGMLYRMKQNAVGLANICILSTAVLIMISSTTALMLGMEEVNDARYPNDFVLYMREETQKENESRLEEVQSFCREQGLPITEEISYTFLSFAGIRDQNRFLVETNMELADDVWNLFFISLSDYNRIMEENWTLDQHEILTYSNRESFDASTLSIFDRDYQIVEHLKEFPGNGLATANIANSQYIVVRDLEELYELCELQKQVYQEAASQVRLYYGFDTDLSSEEQYAFSGRLSKYLKEREYQGTMEFKAGAKKDFFGVYGGFFFIGIFLGTLFSMAAVLIIYYKQISEGYEDRERFMIMQKVGMSWKEVRSSIHSQVLTVFFLPLAVAGMHVLVAFPLISKMLALFNLMNVRLYACCTLVCFLTFAGLYILVYALTARAYYRIVRR